ncbi:MAG: CPBP family intramembrane glutamic endopeptidase [Undibacterium umbellatum]|uniref:CPBP family intramembrane glutamic endopeptidase n=1 Tax=Undibacterium umbellatum TaxID=2762300 RepID=UPI003BB627C3
MTATFSSESRLRSPRNSYYLVIGLVLILGLSLFLKNCTIEKVATIVAFVILIVSATVFIEIEREIKFNRLLLLQLGIVICYLLLFTYWLSLSVNLMELIALIEKFVTPNALLKIVAGAIGVAVFEEVMFRRFLLDFLRKGMSTKWAIFWSSFAFFFLHFTFNPFLFLSGVFYANLALRFRSLIVVILLHAFYNIIGYLSKVKSLQVSHLGDSLTASQWLVGSNTITDMIFMGVLTLYIAGMWIFKKVKASKREYTVEVVKVVRE